MKKKILGLDIGVSSVGIALIEQNDTGKHIIDMAVRVIPEDPNFHGKFYSGNTASKNLDRTTARGIRRNNQRFKKRRDYLYKTLREYSMFPGEELFRVPSLGLYGLRSSAVESKISLQELGRVFIHLNQRRGFLSNRKSRSEEENSTEYKQRIEHLENELEGKTIGQQLFHELKNANRTFEVLLRERTYLRNSYLNEFDRIWECQKKYYPEILTGGINEDENRGTLYDKLRNQIIYFQRPLKTQKHLVSNCSFEKHHKAVTKSSPYFEMFRIWQKVNDLDVTFENGTKIKPTQEQRHGLFNALFYGENLNKQFKLTVSEIKKILGLKRTEGYLNFTELDGSRTYKMLKSALEKAGLKPDDYLFFNPKINDEKGGLFELWHLTYSIPDEKELCKALVKRFNLNPDQAEIIAKEVGYNSDFGNLSTRAIRKLLPHLEKGLNYSSACDAIGYDHSGYKSKIQLKEKLDQLKPNSLRNPVVEQVLNQVVNIVNLVIQKHGKPDEIRVELARELRNSAKTRKNISKQNSINKKENDKVRLVLASEYGFKIVNGRDVQRYKLWTETENQCLYCTNPISKTDFINGNGEIEHILPKSRSFSNNANNFILAHRKCNSGKEGKNQMTAYDFMLSKGEEAFNQYIKKVNDLYKDGKGSISKGKFENLMTKGEDIPSDFVERMKKDTQYIVVETVKMLKSICDKTYTTTGQITDFLREKWELKEVLQEINIEKYRAIGQIETKEYKDRQGGIKKYEKIKDWNKRDDHRHHAVDALICALTDQKIVYKLNNLNKIYQLERDALNTEEIKELEEFINKSEIFEDKNFDLKFFSDLSDNWFDMPMADLRNQSKRFLEHIFVSIKKSSKVLSKNLNSPKNIHPKTEWTPRGRLHEETIMGRVLRPSGKPVKINAKFSSLEFVMNPVIKTILKEHLLKFDNKSEIAFSPKVLKESPILFRNEEVREVKVFEEVCTKRLPLSENLTSAQIEKIADEKIKALVKSRVNGKGIKEAFGNLKENPLWLNEEKGIKIKSITVYDEGKFEKVRNGFVKPGGNHHALIYINENGKYKEKVVSFWEAVEIGKLNIAQNNHPYPIINRKDDPYFGKFLYSVQINDLFIFDYRHSINPTEEEEINFLDPKNRSALSKKLFRIQKISKNSAGTFQIDFRHHLETTVERNNPELRGIAWERFQSNDHLKRITKIRINHLGDIIKIGE